jgi:outer membrane receptor protein involved in Fe transport
LESTGFNDGPLKWRGNGGISAESGSWGFDVAGQYFGSYHICDAQSLATGPSCDRSIKEYGKSRVPAQLYLDLSVSKKLRALGPFLSKSEIRLTVENVSDKAPLEYALSYGDPRMRRFVLTLRTQLAK